MSPESRKVVPCPHKKPTPRRKVCDDCQAQRRRERDHVYYYTVRRKVKVMKG